MQGENEEKEQDSELRADEDWKKSVADEKAKLREEQQKHERQPGPEPTGPLSFPEPSLQVFLAGLYTQTLIALGAVENPITGKKQGNTAEAAYLIDTIAMLQDKTQGNLTNEESSYLQNILTDLRMRYVSAAEQAGDEDKDEQPAQAK